MRNLFLVELNKLQSTKDTMLVAGPIFTNIRMVKKTVMKFCASRKICIGILLDPEVVVFSKSKKEIYIRTISLNYPYPLKPFKFRRTYF